MWDVGRDKGVMVIVDLKEQAGSAMSVRSQLGEPMGDPKVTLAALAFASDLGRLLWRMKYGQDVKRGGLHRATLLLADRIRQPGRFTRSKFTGLTHGQRRLQQKGVPVEREQSDIVERFARRVIVEWIDDACPKCSGRGTIGRGEVARASWKSCKVCHGAGRICTGEERIPFAARRDGRGPIVVRDYERCGVCSGLGRIEVEWREKRTGRQICSDCAGSGRRAPHEAGRARALGVPLEQYRAHWASLFHGVLALLDSADGRAEDTVRRQLSVR